MNFPAQILILNLDSRPDRWAEVSTEIAKWTAIHPETLVERMSATPGGGAGCAFTHAQAVKRVADTKLHTLIVEDDFQWLVSIEEATARMRQFGQAIQRFGFTQASHCPNALHDVESIPHFEMWARVHRSTDASGYWVHPDAAPRLADILAVAAEKMRLTGEHWHYMNDIAWDQLRKEFPCYAFMPRLARQRAGHSDLMGRVVDYQ